MIEIKQKVHFRQGRRTRKEMGIGEAPPEEPTGRVPRVSRLMALAIRLDQLIRDGVVADQAELARLGHVSRARVTQIMNLLQLAPDIQEEILMLPRSLESRDVVSEHELRQVVAETTWAEQRRIWAIAKGTRLRSTLRQRDR